MAGRRTRPTVRPRGWRRSALPGGYAAVRAPKATDVGTSTFNPGPGRHRTGSGYRHPPGRGCSRRNRSEHDRHVVGEATVVQRMLGEEASVDLTPVAQGAIALALEVRVLLGHLVERDDRDVGRLQQRAGMPGPVEHDAQGPDLRQLLALSLVVPQGGGGRRLGACEHERRPARRRARGGRPERPGGGRQHLERVRSEVAGEVGDSGLAARDPPVGLDVLLRSRPIGHSRRLPRTAGRVPTRRRRLRPRTRSEGGPESVDGQ